MTAKKNIPKIKQIGVRLPTAIVKEIDHLRIETDVSRNKLIEEAVNDLLKKYNNHKASGTVDK